jgi:hypothetical protein
MAKNHRQTCTPTAAAAVVVGIRTDRRQPLKPMPKVSDGRQQKWKMFADGQAAKVGLDA